MAVSDSVLAVILPPLIPDPELSHLTPEQRKLSSPPPSMHADAAKTSQQEAAGSDNNHGSGMLGRLLPSRLFQAEIADLYAASFSCSYMAASREGSTLSKGIEWNSFRFLRFSVHSCFVGFHLTLSGISAVSLGGKLNFASGVGIDSLVAASVGDSFRTWLRASSCTFGKIQPVMNAAVASSALIIICFDEFTTFRMNFPMVLSTTGAKTRSLLAQMRKVGFSSVSDSVSDNGFPSFFFSRACNKDALNFVHNMLEKLFRHGADGLMRACIDYLHEPRLVCLLVSSQIPS